MADHGRWFCTLVFGYMTSPPRKNITGTTFHHAAVNSNGLCTFFFLTAPQRREFFFKQWSNLVLVLEVSFIKLITSPSCNVKTLCWTDKSSYWFNFSWITSHCLLIWYWFWTLLVGCWFALVVELSKHIFQQFYGFPDLLEKLQVYTGHVSMSQNQPHQLNT